MSVGVSRVLFSDKFNTWNIKGDNCQCTAHKWSEISYCKFRERCLILSNSSGNRLAKLLSSCLITAFMGLQLKNECGSCSAHFLTSAGLCSFHQYKLTLCGQILFKPKYFSLLPSEKIPDVLEENKDVKLNFGQDYVQKARLHFVLSESEEDVWYLLTFPTWIFSGHLCSHMARNCFYKLWSSCILNLLWTY